MTEEYTSGSKIKKIISDVAKLHEITPEQLLCPDQHWPLSEWRRELYWKLLTNTNASSIAIGRAVHRTHTTVLYGAARYAAEKDLPAPRGSLFHWRKKAERNRIAAREAHRKSKLAKQRGE